MKLKVIVHDAEEGGYWAEAAAQTNDATDRLAHHEVPV
jgi:hypothetical protein